MRLIDQPSQARFVDVFLQHIEHGGWNRLDISVAWAREVAVAAIRPALELFLQAGGGVRVTVGVDLRGTTEEALRMLLSLPGDTKVFVYHNESGAETFHPKVYRFSSETRARLAVGSNNLTEGGLTSNCEAILEVEEPRTAAVLRESDELFSRLQTPSDFVKRLDDPFLSKLVQAGYVLTEFEVRMRRATEHQAGARTRVPGNKPLFGRTSRVRMSRGRQVEAGELVDASTLLLRPRRASETERRTQIQFPIRLMSKPYCAGVTSLRSSQGGVRHKIREANARGKRNTLKVEVPEIETLDSFVMRLNRKGSDLVYDVYDTASPEGRRVWKALEDGLQTSPAVTISTVPGNINSSTLFRFI